MGWSCNTCGHSWFFDDMGNEYAVSPPPRPPLGSPAAGIGSGIAPPLGTRGLSHCPNCGSSDVEALQTGPAYIGDGE